MNLKEIREQFVLKSGRYDLITESGEDSGANFFIQAGQRLIDKSGDFNTGQIASWLDTLSSGAAEFVVPNCWAIQTIHGKDASASSDNWNLFTQVHSFTTPDCCFSCGQMYTIVPIRELPTLRDRPAKDINIPAYSLSISSTLTEEAVQGVRVKLFPKLSRDTLVRVAGNFYSPTLVQDTDANYWSNWHPEILLKAASNPN